MKTLFINGSPKGIVGNSEIFIREICAGMKETQDVAYIVKESAEELAKRILQYERVIIVMPLYVFTMPGIVLELMEAMEDKDCTGISFGYLVQQGFDESKYSEILRYQLEQFTKRVNGIYLGCLIRGSSAGVCFMPPVMNRKLFQQLHQLGTCLESENHFDQAIAYNFEKVYELKGFKLIWYRFMSSLNITDSFWNSRLKSNQAYEKRYDRPYL